MTIEKIKNTPELVDFMIDESVIASSREKLHKRLEELCKLAIKALEQEPCGDAISRQGVIETIENEQKKIMRSDWAIDQAKFSAMSEIRALIEELPSVSMEKPKKCGDLISRQEAIELMENIRELNRYYHPKGNDDKTLVSEVIDRLKQLPSVNTEKPNRWIPISKRFPSDNKHVIVSVLDDHGDTPWKYTTVAWLCNGVWISDNDILCGTAVAWMPLPQPYKAESEETL